MAEDSFTPPPASGANSDADADRLRRRRSFDDAATTYAMARPDYPGALFDDLVTLAHLTPSGRILEVGLGTGRATLPLARRGYTIIGVELGAQLAAVARATLAPYPNARIEVADFEQWPLSPALTGQCDLVISASAWHWIDPAIGYPKAAAALTSTGALALLWASQHAPDPAVDPTNTHETPVATPVSASPTYPLGASDSPSLGSSLAPADETSFDDALRALLRALAPQTLQGRGSDWFRQGQPEATPTTPTSPNTLLPQGRGRFARAEEITTLASAWFDPPITRTYAFTVHYDATSYVQLLDSYSSYRTLDAAVRARVFTAIQTLIEDQYGGRITRDWHAELYVAHRRRL